MPAARRTVRAAGLPPPPPPPPASAWASWAPAGWAPSWAPRSPPQVTTSSRPPASPPPPPSAPPACCPACRCCTPTRWSPPPTWWSWPCPTTPSPGLVAGLAETGVWRAGQLAFHTSGAHGLAVLEPAERAGVLPLALHPAMTFSGAPEDADRLVGAPFGVTSRPEHRAVAETLVLEMGGEPFFVAEEDRRLYHAALVTGANHLVTLVAEAADLLRTAGVDRSGPRARAAATAALDNGLRRGDRGLTGPVSRGDVGTVADHLETLTERAPARWPPTSPWRSGPPSAPWRPGGSSGTRVLRCSTCSTRRPRRRPGGLPVTAVTVPAVAETAADLRRLRDALPRPGRAGADDGGAARGPPDAASARPASRRRASSSRCSSTRPSSARVRTSTATRAPGTPTWPRSPRRASTWSSTPRVDDVYPPGALGVTVDPGPLGDVLEGAVRPGPLRRRADRRRQALRPGPARPRGLRREGLPAAHPDPRDGARARARRARWSACRPSVRTTAWRCPAATAT